MSRARYLNKDPRQTAAAPEEHGSGCFSVYWLTPLAAVFITCILTLFALQATIPTSALPLDPSIAITENAALNAPMPASGMSVSIEQTSQSTTPLFEISNTATSGISPIFTKQIQYWAGDIVRWAGDSSLDPNLVAVIMQIESCGDPRAVSSSGAIGLFQVMPFHFHITDNPFNPDTNALRGLNYLARSLETAGGNARLAMAGYNGGIGVIARGEWTWPAETHRYVRYGAPIYEDSISGADSSAALEEWYGKYGAGLCRQASRRLGIPE
jgi:soluble lytic murein transglycosylase-like protein